MMRVVLDANVIVSAAYSFGNPSSKIASVLRAGIRGHYMPIVSNHILGEVRSAVSKPFFAERLVPDLVEHILADLEERAELVELTQVVEGVATHWQDDRVLSTALSGEADVLVTGDRELLELDHPYPFRIIHPDEFAGLL